MNYTDPSNSAQGLAALGRFGDSTLVHMQPQEVAGLQALAMSQGGSLTTNPDTGLPEAFSIGDFLSSLAPTAAGAIGGAIGGPWGAVLAGAATGAALNRDNPVMGAVTGGIGGWGGGNIGSGLKAAAAEPAKAAAAQAAAPAGVSGVGSLGTPLAPTAQEAVNIASTTAAGPSGIAALGEGAKNLGTQTGRDAFINSFGSTGKAAFGVGAPLGMAALSGIEPPKMPGEEEYDPRAQLNLNFDTGLRLFDRGGAVFEDGDGYAKGGYLDGPGDGMSDSIRATIEGKQPARLADGEFVIPADVVSHLGNGSTKAGAQRLYKMLAKVRKARTGTTKQGKEIKAEKYLPV
jgi:hypothetical protein